MGPGDPFGEASPASSRSGNAGPPRSDGPQTSPRLAAGAGLGVLFGVVVLLKGFVAAFFVVGCAIGGALIAQAIGKTRSWNLRAAWRALVGGNDA